MYFDSHAHMDDRRFSEDRQEIFADLKEAGFVGIMNVGCDLASSRRSIALAEEYDFVYASVGSHPDDADHVDGKLLDQYRQLAQHPKVLAIGEIGLDYHYEDVPRSRQIIAFEEQMELAEALDLPVIVHMREAVEDAMAVVKRHPKVTGVFHCFSGSADLAKWLVERGWYVGFTGVLTFKNARRALEAAQAIPLDRILLETDCPYMAPEPFRGRRNDSRYLPYMAAKLAELKGITPEEAAKQTAQNAERLFRIERQ